MNGTYRSNGSLSALPETQGSPRVVLRSVIAAVDGHHPEQSSVKGLSSYRQVFAFLFAELGVHLSGVVLAEQTVGLEVIFRVSTTRSTLK